MPAITVYQVGGQVFYWRGVSKAKSAWAHRWHSPGVIICLEQNNLHDQPEVDPETGLPTEPGWIHRPYAGRGRRGRTWVRVRAELQPQPEQGEETKPDAPLPPQTSQRLRRQRPTARQRSRCPARLKQKPPPSTKPNKDYHNILAPKQVPASSATPRSPSSEPTTRSRVLSSGRLRSLSHSKGHGHRSRSLSQRHAPPRHQAPRVKTRGGELHHAPVTEPAFEPVPGQRRSAEHDPADECAKRPHSGADFSMTCPNNFALGYDEHEIFPLANDPRPKPWRT